MLCRTISLVPPLVISLLALSSSNAQDYYGHYDFYYQDDGIFCAAGSGGLEPGFREGAQTHNLGWVLVGECVSGCGALGDGWDGANVWKDTNHYGERDCRCLRDAASRGGPWPDSRWETALIERCTGE